MCSRRISCPRPRLPASCIWLVLPWPALFLPLTLHVNRSIWRVRNASADQEPLASDLKRLSILICRSLPWESAFQLEVSCFLVFLHRHWLKGFLPANNQGHVPYRDSTLTYLLQDSLEKNSKTLMFVQISPSADDSVSMHENRRPCLSTNFLSMQSESVTTLRFGENVRKVELGKAQKNTVA